MERLEQSLELLEEARRETRISRQDVAGNELVNDSGLAVAPDLAGNVPGVL